jgi:hypothetical protein
MPRGMSLFTSNRVLKLKPLKKPPDPPNKKRSVVEKPKRKKRTPIDRIFAQPNENTPTFIAKLQKRKYG